MRTLVVRPSSSTSIAAIIGFVELTRAGQLMVNVTFQPMIVYPVVAALYFAVCWPISILAMRLERRRGFAQLRIPRRLR